MNMLRKVFIVIFFSSSFFIGDGCEEVCDTLSLADLIVESISPVFQESVVDGDKYELVHMSLNTIKGIACENLECKGAETADKHVYRQNIYYSSSPTDYWGNPVDEYEFANDALEPCAYAENNDVLKFLVDGYYLIEGIVDFYQEVTERNPDNNTYTTGLDGKKSSIIIRVNRGLKAQKSANGEIRYIERISSATRYYNNDR